MLQAYKANTSDLGGYTAPAPGPAPLLGAIAALAQARQLRQRIRTSTNSHQLRRI